MRSQEVYFYLRAMSLRGYTSETNICWESIVNLFDTFTDLTSIFLFTTCFLFIARKVAKYVGLVDKPNFRKRHQGMIPLVGGISVFAGICYAFAIANYYVPHVKL